MASCKRSVAARTLSSSPCIVVHALCRGGALRRLLAGDVGADDPDPSSRIALSSLLHVFWRAGPGGGTSKLAGPWPLSAASSMDEVDGVGDGALDSGCASSKQSASTRVSSKFKTTYKHED